ncbi:MAG: RidA family protein [Candidatus Omnitrophica bacterium]|nr:RidA family protein [Candidatus Omnitrophota bacterium]
MNLESKFKELGLVLPPAPKPAGAYHPLVISGTTGYVSGQISKRHDGFLITGKTGLDLTLEQARQAAEYCALNVLSLLNTHLEMERFVRLIRVVGYVQSAPEFYDIPKVIDGASELFAKILGQPGIHARSAVGVANLPMNAAVELEVTFEVTA